MITRRFVDVPAGTIHCAIAGRGRPVLLLHQTPRSWDEYRDVLPLLGRHFQAIAIDTIGYGDSSKPPLVNDSIEHWAEVATSVADALGIARFAVIGHHTGAVIAIEMAAVYPERIDAAVLSASPFVDAAFRERHARPSRIDNALRRAGRVAPPRGHDPAASSPLQGAPALASAGRFAGGQHAARLPCSTLASAPHHGPLGRVQLRFVGSMTQ